MGNFMQPLDDYLEGFLEEKKSCNNLEITLNSLIMIRNTDTRESDYVIT